MKYFVSLLFLLAFYQEERNVQRVMKCAFYYYVITVFFVSGSQSSILWIKFQVKFFSCFKNIWMGSDQNSNWLNILPVKAFLTAVQRKEEHNKHTRILSLEYSPSNRYLCLCKTEIPFISWTWSCSHNIFPMSLTLLMTHRVQKSSSSTLLLK